LPSSSLLPFFCLPSFGLGWGCIMRLPDIPHRVGEKGGARGQRGKAGCHVSYILLCCILLACIWAGAVAAGRGGGPRGKAGCRVELYLYGYGALLYIISIAFCLFASELGLLRLELYVRVRESAAGGECVEKAPNQATSEGQSAANKAPTNQGLAQSACNLVKVRNPVPKNRFGGLSLPAHAGRRWRPPRAPQGAWEAVLVDPGTGAARVDAWSAARAARGLWGWCASRTRPADPDDRLQAHASRARRSKRTRHPSLARDDSSSRCAGGAVGDEPMWF